jgi:hypothetical protein
VIVAPQVFVVESDSDLKEPSVVELHVAREANVAALTWTSCPIRRNGRKVPVPPASVPISATLLFHCPKMIRSKLVAPAVYFANNGLYSASIAWPTPFKLLSSFTRRTPWLTCPETGVTFYTTEKGGTIPKRSTFACAVDGSQNDVLEAIKHSGKTGPLVVQFENARSPSAP